MAALKYMFSRTTVALVGGGSCFGLGYWFSENEDRLLSRSILTYGLPQTATQIIRYDDYLLCYDHSLRIPIWVGERLSLKNFKGDTDRKDLHFTVDPRIPALFASKNEDYLKSGWSRGHMAAAGNYKRSKKEMRDTFFLANVVPQDFQNNEGYWNLMELYVRDLAKKFEDVYVYSGPLFLSNKDETSGKDLVQYQVIGRDKVAVPTHLYKAVLARNPGQNPALGVFIVPNRSISFGDPLPQYEVKLGTLEQNAGVQFFPKLNRNTVQNLCTVEGCKLMDLRQFTVMYLSRRLKDKQTLNQLEKLWLEGKQKGVENEPEIKLLYEAKRNEILKANSEKINP